MIWNQILSTVFEDLELKETDFSVTDIACLEKKLDETTQRIWQEGYDEAFEDGKEDGFDEGYNKATENLKDKIQDFLDNLD